MLALGSINAEVPFLPESEVRGSVLPRGQPARAQPALDGISGRLFELRRVAPTHRVQVPRDITEQIEQRSEEEAAKSMATAKRSVGERCARVGAHGAACTTVVT